MIDLIIAATLILGDDRIIACERLNIEVGQVVCLNDCHANKLACPGDEPITCNLLDIVHPNMVKFVDLTGRLR